MAIHMPWTRLIRFISEEENLVYFGDAIAPGKGFDVGAKENADKLTARIIQGNPLSPDCVVLDKTVRVKRLLSPLSRDMVPALRCIGGNYMSHVKELGITPPKNPAMFAKFPNAVADYGDDIEIPKLIQDNQVDYEGELIVVIGQDCKDVKYEDAMKYVLGYTVGNDLSARKWQRDPELVGTFPPPQMTFAKSFDGFCPMGPCLVTAELVPDPHNLSLKTRINGELRQDGNTSDFVHNIPRLIEFCSQGNTLQAGSIIMTGTCSGVGIGLKPPQFLQSGDLVEITFENVGTLRHGIKYV